MSNSFTFEMPLQKAYLDDEGRMHVVGVVSDSLPDRQNDIIRPQALRSMAAQLTRKNLPLLENHRGTFEMGLSRKGTVVRKDNGDYEVEADFELVDEDPNAQRLFKEVQSGRSQRQLSIGAKFPAGPDTFRYIRKDGHMLREIRDLDMDHVACTRVDKAANPRTRFIATIMKAASEVEWEYLEKDVVDWDDLDEKWGEEVTEKGAVPYSPETTGPREGAWSFNAEDGNRLVNGGGWPLFKRAFAWFDSAEGAVPENKAAYSLPHHKRGEGGGLDTFARGVMAAAGALLGARGGVKKVPASDRPAVARHLLRHYAQFDITPPERLRELTKSEDGIVEPITHEEFVKVHTAPDSPLDMSWCSKEWWEMDKELKKEDEVTKDTEQKKEEAPKTEPSKEEVNTEKASPEEAAEKRNMDGTGPEGKGPRTGRGMGMCAKCGAPLNKAGVCTKCGASMKKDEDDSEAKTEEAEEEKKDEKADEDPEVEKGMSILKRLGQMFSDFTSPAKEEAIDLDAIKSQVEGQEVILKNYEDVRLAVGLVEQCEKTLVGEFPTDVVELPGTEGLRAAIASATHSEAGVTDFSEVITLGANSLREAINKALGRSEEVPKDETPAEPVDDKADESDAEVTESDTPADVAPADAAEEKPEEDNVEKAAKCNTKKGKMPPSEDMPEEDMEPQRRRRVRIMVAGKAKKDEADTDFEKDDVLLDGEELSNFVTQAVAKEFSAINEKIDALVKDMNTKFVATAKSVDDKINEITKSADTVVKTIEKMDERVYTVEKTSGRRQSLLGQEHVAAPKADGGVWGGVITNAVDRGRSKRR